MSKISLEGNASGTGTFTIAAPNSNSNYTLTLPTETGTVLTNSGNQTGVFSALTVNSNNISADNSLGFRNRIINGDMRIDQRNAGAAVTVNAANRIYGVDRFFGYGQATDGVFTIDQDTDAPIGFVNSTKVTTTTADASVGASQFYLFSQSIEGTNVADLAWGTASAKTVTLSFWVRSSLTGTFGGALLNGAANRSYPFTYTINSANTWEYKTITIPGDTSGTWLTTTGTGLQIYWDLGSGSSNIGTAGSWSGSAFYGVTGGTKLISTLNATWYITGVQLEVGSVATPFERRPYGTELALCQRYAYVLRSNGTLCQVGFASCQSTTSAFLGIYLPVTPRTNPTGITASGATVLTLYPANVNNNTTAIGVSSGWTFAGNFVSMLLTTASGLTGGQVAPVYFNSSTATIEFTGMEL